MIKKLLYILILLLAYVNTTFAQQGKVDQTFNTQDDGQSGDGFNGAVRTLALQEDGNLIVGGEYLSLNGVPASYLTRLNPDGSIDESFNTGSGFNGKIYASCLQPDGKIILGGSFTTFNGVSAGRLIRLNQDGSYDAAFNTTIGATTGIVYDITMQSDGKIIIVGSFTKYTNNTVNRVARLFPDGTLDLSFVTGSGSAVNITHAKITSDNKIILTGNFISFNGILANRIIRLNNNGSVDSSFNIGSGFNDDVNAIAIQADGKIVLGGNFTSYNEISANRIIRLNADGTRDQNFLTGAGFSKEGVQAIKINAYGDLMIGGSFTGLYNNAEVNRLVFLNEDGTIKSNFDIGSGPASASVVSLEFDQEGSWFVGGTFSAFNGQNQGRLAKIDSHGEHDISYLSSGVGFDNSVLSLLPLPDKRTIVAGNFKKFNTKTSSKITCLLEDGSFDHSFNIGNSGANNLVKATALQADGKIILGGNFTRYNEINANRTCRIFSNGETDNSFAIGDGFNAQIYAVTIQSDQKIILAGAFTKFNGSTSNAGRIVRLLPEGSKDPDFNVGSGADGIIEAVVIQPDGKILVGGHFKNFNEIPFAGLVRLNSDGSIDQSFNVGIGFDKYVYAIALQSDQKIIVGGNFLVFNGVSQKRILRLNTNGTLDATFESGTGFSKLDVRSILVQPDDRILVGGAFYGTYKNIQCSRLIRLQKSGNYDDSFSAPLNNTLYAMKFTDEYRLLIGGNFNSVNGISKHRIARLKLCVNNTIWNGTSWSNGYPSPGKDVYFKEDFPNLTTTNICGCSIDLGKTATLLEKNTLGIEFSYTGLGTLVLNDKANLYQSDDDMVNTGIVHIKRKTNPVIRYDLTYWSSPVDNQKISDFSPETLGDKYFWFDPVSYWNINYNGTMIMNSGQGYSIRAPQNFSITERAVFEGVFKGIPNNGKIEIDFNVANAYYLIGNPYPSPINADLFIRKNSSHLQGGLYFWTHNTPPANNKYSGDDYAVYNLLGGVATTAALNPGVSNSTPDGIIAAAQGFFVKSNNSGLIEFNNNMRVSADNATFYKPAKSTTEIPDAKHRFWINFYNENGFKQILLGYTEEASNGLDPLFDAEVMSSNPEIGFYSIVENKKLVIQGRAMPFDENDLVALGYKTTSDGVFNLQLDHQDAFFKNIDIFLMDKKLDKIHNLSESRYQFNSEAGTFNNRFSILYTNKTLENKEFQMDSKRLLISVDQHIINIQSLKENLKEVAVFDISGNQLYKKDKLESKSFSIQDLFSSHQVLLVQVVLDDGSSTSVKVIY